YARRCTSCDRRSATHPVRNEEILCTPCRIKRDSGTGLKRAWVGSFRRYLEQAGASTAYAAARPAAGWDEVVRPQDVDDIAAASSPPGYIGFIYADGDEMGRHLS